MLLSFVHAWLLPAWSSMFRLPHQQNQLLAPLLHPQGFVCKVVETDHLNVYCKAAAKTKASSKINKSEAPSSTLTFDF